MNRKSPSYRVRSLPRVLALYLSLSLMLACVVAVDGNTQTCTTPVLDEMFPEQSATVDPLDIVAIWVTFDAGSFLMDPETINLNSFKLYYHNQYQEVDEVSFDVSAQMACLFPKNCLPYGSIIQLHLFDEIQSDEPCPLENFTGWTFLTETAPPVATCAGASIAVSGFTNIHLFTEDFAQSETSIAVNPNDPLDILVGTNIGELSIFSRPMQASYRSNGALNSWDYGRLPGWIGNYRFFDPAVGFDDQDNAYYCFGRNYCQFGAAESCNSTEDMIIIYKREPIFGDWNLPIEVTFGDYTPDKPHMAIDIVSNTATKNDIYVAWTEFESRDIGVVYPSNVIFARSVDEGAHFIDHQSISKNIAGLLGGSLGVNLAVGPTSGDNSRLYATWSIQSVSNETGTGIGFNYSTDGGDNWGSAEEIVQNVSGIRDLSGDDLPPKEISVRSFPSMAVDTAAGDLGIVYIVWAEKTSSQQPYDADVFLIKSTDGGLTWPDATDPIRVNCDPIGNGKDQWFPWVSVDPGGGVNVVFYDCRNDASNLMTEVWVARSADNGNTFSDFRVGDASFEPCPINGSYIGDYIGIASSVNGIYPCWNDNRYIPTGLLDGVHQVFIADVEFLQGTIASDKTISNTVLLTGDVTVEAGAKLTINAPAEIWIDSGKGLRIDVFGELVIAGEDGDSVIIRSIATEGGDNDWFGIVHHDGAGDMTIDYARIENAYKGVWFIDTSGADINATIDHTEFRDCYMSGVTVESKTTNTVTISNSTFQDIKYYGVQIFKGTPTVENNSFTGNMLNAIRVDGSSSRITGGLIKGNTFDNLTASNLIAVNLSSISDDGRDYSIGENLLENNTFGPNWSSANQTAIQVYDCSDPLRFYMTQIAGSSADLPGYGILNFNTKTFIQGDNDSTEFKSQIRDALYGLYCMSSMPTITDYAVVRECSFKNNAYSVWIYDGSMVDLGAGSSDKGNNVFYGYCKNNCGDLNLDFCWNVWNDGSPDPVLAEYNYWSGQYCGPSDPNSCWPFVTGIGTTDHDPKLIKNPFSIGGPFKIVAEEDQGQPAEVSLSFDATNYPNPFNASTIIQFGLENAGPVNVAIYNVLGQQIRILTDGFRSAGHHEVPWDGRDRFGNPVGSGVYFYRILTTEKQITKQMVILK